MRELPIADTPHELSSQLREVGRLWASSESRPRLRLDIKRHWDELVDAWALSALPLVVRKSGGVRGALITHSSGRNIVIADNSPAQWSFMRAFRGFTYSLGDIATQLERDDIPFAFATKSAEKAQMHFKRTLSAADNLNKRGWKLCHIQEVGLGLRNPVERFPIERLIEHFRLLLMPSNHFLVPLHLSGLGELPEVIDEVQKRDL